MRTRGWIAIVCAALLPGLAEGRTFVDVVKVDFGGTEADLRPGWTSFNNAQGDFTVGGISFHLTAEDLPHGSKLRVGSGDALVKDILSQEDSGTDGHYTLTITGGLTAGTEYTFRSFHNNPMENDWLGKSKKSGKKKRSPARNTATQTFSGGFSAITGNEATGTVPDRCVNEADALQLTTTFTASTGNVVIEFTRSWHFCIAGFTMEWTPGPFDITSSGGQRRRARPPAETVPAGGLVAPNLTRLQPTGAQVGLAYRYCGGGRFRGVEGRQVRSQVRQPDSPFGQLAGWVLRTPMYRIMVNFLINGYPGK